MEDLLDILKRMKSWAPHVLANQNWLQWQRCEALKLWKPIRKENDWDVTLRTIDEVNFEELGQNYLPIKTNFYLRGSETLSLRTASPRWKWYHVITLFSKTVHPHHCNITYLMTMWYVMSLCVQDMFTKMATSLRKLWMNFKRFFSNKLANAYFALFFLNLPAKNLFLVDQLIILIFISIKFGFQRSSWIICLNWEINSKLKKKHSIFPSS